jgi:hypothetical protein
LDSPLRSLLTVPNTTLRTSRCSWLALIPQAPASAQMCILYVHVTIPFNAYHNACVRAGVRDCQHTELKSAVPKNHIKTRARIPKATDDMKLLPRYGRSPRVLPIRFLATCGCMPMIVGCLFLFQRETFLGMPEYGERGRSLFRFRV